MDREHAAARRRAYRRAWYSNNRERERARKQRKYFADVEAARARSRRNHLKHQYGITPEERDAILASQGGCCAVCKSPNPNWRRGWHVDHCHDTGRIRGILCQFCNLMIGMAKDQPQVLTDAVAYLKAGVYGRD